MIQRETRHEIAVRTIEQQQRDAVPFLHESGCQKVLFVEEWYSITIQLEQAALARQARSIPFPK